MALAVRRFDCPLIFQLQEPAGNLSCAFHYHPGFLDQALFGTVIYYEISCGGTKYSNRFADVYKQCITTHYIQV